MNRMIISCLVLCLLGCGTKSSQTTVSILWDITDKEITQPRANDIRSFINGDDMWAGINLHLTCMTDVEYGGEKSLSLSSENALFSNELERKQTWETFLGEVDGLLTLPDQSPRPYSVIYPAIARELNRLAELTEGRKVLLIYSDLLDNTDRISFLRHPRLLEKPEVAWEKLEEVYGLHLADKLSGIEVYMVYRARNLNDSNTFSRITAMYRDQLVARGAQLTVKSNL